MHLQLSSLLSMLPLVLAIPTAKRSEPAPLLVPRGEAFTLIPDEYIVKLKKGSASAALEDAIKIIPGDANHVFESIFRGFTGKLDSSTLEALRSHPDVDYVEQNAFYEAFGAVTQSQAPWGLARLSHLQPGSGDYVYDSSAGEGTCAYVVDSGLYAAHPDFEGRAEFLGSFIGDYNDNCLHGTHVAGTIGSRTFGVAKKTSIYGIKVLEYSAEARTCGSDNSIIMAGMEHVARDAAGRSCPNGVVVNLSLGGGWSQSINDAAAALVRQGFFVAVAAGNGDRNHFPMDAAAVSPASEPSVCTVGSVDSDDRTARDSNYGDLVDIHAPGVDVVSTRVGGGYLAMSGTSMATPHITGLGAYFLGLGVASASDMCSFLQYNALQDYIGNLRGRTKNLLAQNGIGAWEQGLRE
ncbi:subtilisin-like protease PR1G [Metarhizium album ARSEF 1941]|uniref:Subtilisin-like protease PR1G n=1 Tax=Metarhizium album (strain ARSEF 1941) TaxID=1081103 RepID=A0A0B2WT54_METAS|nr:subtilisin-like protease PR1G [Metarhizium album ARSEF 1941]KHN96150.1 subtilisin-like protease PR1G [Metarhizium album ARSEF 1941]